MQTIDEIEIRLLKAGCPPPFIERHVTKLLSGDNCILDASSVSGFTLTMINPSQRLGIL